MSPSRTAKPITIVLADDHTIVREGLRTLLEAEGDITVIGEAATGREALALTRRLFPDVVVMDLAMPLLNGLEATRQIRKALPAARVLILSAYGDEAYVEQVLPLGAAGYLLKHTSAHVLAKAVRVVHTGKTFFCPAITRQLQQRERRNAGAAGGGASRARVAPLSPREREVLQLIAEGQPNKQVATELGISVKTVEKHRQRLMEKLNIHDTAGLTRHAIATGVIESRVQLTFAAPEPVG